MQCENTVQTNSSIQFSLLVLLLSLLKLISVLQQQDGSTVYTVFPASSKLEILGCSRCFVTDDSINYITRGFPKLTVIRNVTLYCGSLFCLLQFLDISCNRSLTDLSMALIGSRLFHLQTLNIEGAILVTDNGVRTLATSKQLQQHLRSLHLDGSPITEQSMLYLMSAFQFHKLGLSRVRSSTASLYLMGKYFTTLRLLTLNGLSGTTCTQVCIEQMGAQLLSLAVLSLVDLPLVCSVDAFETTLLVRLDLRQLPKLNAVSNLLQRSSALQSLRVYDCSNASASSIVSFVSPNLISLVFGNLPDFDAIHVERIGAVCTRLERLQLDKCDQVLPAAISR
jgi:hypothetical protein